MKVNILYKLKEGPWGGGNTFLKALKQEFQNLGVYEENPQKADIILFNSFPFKEEERFKQIYNFKKQGKIIVHRIDGPIFKVRGKDLLIDKIIYKLNNFFADATIFQSAWSRNENYKLGMKKNKFETVIHNGSDKKLFNWQDKSIFTKDKVKLVVTSWSSNIRKGFDTYKYLDENLDFNKYEMTFAGNSPYEFKNIKIIKAPTNEEISKILKQNDIFIGASENEPCSNSFIEALSCGLPAVALNDGGYPELLKGGGELFNNQSDIIAKIDKVANNYERYKQNIDIENADKAAKKYLDFFQTVKVNKKPSLYKLWFIFLCNFFKKVF